MPRVDDIDAGFQAAKRWMAPGDRQELRLRIAKMLHAGGVDFLPGRPAWTPAVRLYILIADAGASDWLAAAGFWKAICGDSNPNVDFLHGFSLGIVD